MFVRLFFAGGPIEGELMLGPSWPPADRGMLPDGPDMARSFAGPGPGPGPGTPRLFRAPLEGEFSSLTEASARVGWW